MTMEITKKVNGEELVLEVSGRLDTATAPDFDAFMTENLANVKSLVLDLKDLEYVSSAGLRVLLATQKKMKGGMKLKNVCELVMEVFEMTGFLDILAIE